jgi:hypothetical protein
MMFLFATIFATVYEKINQNRGKKEVKSIFFNIVNSCLKFFDIFYFYLKIVETKYGFFIESFSLSKNLKKLLSTQTNQELSCLNGIRFITMIWVVIGHNVNWTDLNLISIV